MNDTTYFVLVIKYVIWMATNGEIYSRWATCRLSPELCERWNPSVRCWKGNCSPNIIFQQREKGLFGHKLTKNMRMIVCVSCVKNRKATWWRFPAGKKKKTKPVLQPNRRCFSVLYCQGKQLSFTIHPQNSPWWLRCGHLIIYFFITQYFSSL